VEKYGRAAQATDGNIIRRMRFACWITKATDTHSEYVIFIAFPRQEWLRERASMLHYTHTACIVTITIIMMGTISSSTITTVIIHTVITVIVVITCISIIIIVVLTIVIFAVIVPTFQFMYESEKPNVHNQLLKEIQSGIRLKKVQTNDRSRPQLDGKCSHLMCSRASSKIRATISTCPTSQTARFR
jgi:hypothetical protein